MSLRTSLHQDEASSTENADVRGMRGVVCYSTRYHWLARVHVNEEPSESVRRCNFAVHQDRGNLTCMETSFTS